jgi:hypothetical protein
VFKRRRVFFKQNLLVVPAEADHRRRDVLAAIAPAA